MVNDVRDCYMCKITEGRDFELREAYAKLCENEILKEDFKVTESEKLTHALAFPQNFKTEWIKVVLRKIHDRHL
jgi:hypothetical protein